MVEPGARQRRRPGSAGLPVLLLAGLVLASCASGRSESGRCVYRYATDDSRGGQLRWGPRNNHDPDMTPVFEGEPSPNPN